MKKDIARNNACTQARKTTHGLDGQHQDVDKTPRHFKPTKGDRIVTIDPVTSRHSMCIDSVAWWRSGESVGLATQKVAGSTPGRSALGYSLGQVVHSRVPLSPSRIVRYRSRGGDALRLGR